VFFGMSKKEIFKCRAWRLKKTNVKLGHHVGDSGISHVVYQYPTVESKVFKSGKKQTRFYVITIFERVDELTT
jgi:hypothetical protein